MEHVTSNYEQSQQQSGGTALTFIFMIVHLVLDSSLLLVGPMLWNWRALLLEKVVCPSPMDYSSIDRSSSLVPSQNHPSRGHACLKLVSTGDKWLLRSLDHAIYSVLYPPVNHPAPSTAANFHDPRTSRENDSPGWHECKLVFMVSGSVSLSENVRVHVRLSWSRQSVYLLSLVVWLSHGSMYGCM